MGHARSICFVIVPFSLSLALLLSQPDLLCKLICYIYAGCKVTENIREWSQNSWISIASSCFDTICGLFSCGLAMHGGLFCLVFSADGTN